MEKVSEGESQGTPLRKGQAGGSRQIPTLLQAFSNRERVTLGTHQTEFCEKAWRWGRLT